MILDYLCASGTISINAQDFGMVRVEEWDIPWQILATSKQTRREALTKQLGVQLDLAVSDGCNGSDWQYWLQLLTEEISRKMPNRIRSAVTFLRLRGQVTHTYLYPVDLFPNLASLSFRNMFLLTENIAMPMPPSRLRPRLRSVLIEEREFTGLSENARRMVDAFILGYHKGLSTAGFKLYVMGRATTCAPA